MDMASGWHGELSKIFHSICTKYSSLNLVIPICIFGPTDLLTSLLTGQLFSYYKWEQHEMYSSLAYHWLTPTSLHAPSCVFVIQWGKWHLSYNLNFDYAAAAAQDVPPVVKPEDPMPKLKCSWTDTVKYTCP